MLDATEDGFRDWVVLRRDSLRNTAFLLSGDWFLADDLVQEAMTRLYGSWSRVARVANPEAYARKTVVNLFLDHTRRPSRRETSVAVVPDTRITADASTASDYRSQLIEALRRVPPGQRAVLVLRYWDDMSVDQTAAVLDTSPSNVKSQASRGLVALREACVELGLPVDASTSEETR